MTAVYLVFTDLDGSLLDHDSYDYGPAEPALQLLESLRIPVIMVSSKTRAEMLELRREIGNEHPFIAENGAAVYIPERYFVRAPPDCPPSEGYWVHAMAPPRERWRESLDALRERLPGSFREFSGAGVEGVAAMTGLPLEKAALALQREYSEPVLWRGSDENLSLFTRELESQGARVQRGGRFFTVTGDCDKGRAVDWLRRQYALAAGASAVYDLAIGDGQNDAPMLDRAHRALLIPARDRSLPALERRDGVLLGEGYGPHAWASGVREWLHERYTVSEDA